MDPFLRTLPGRLRPSLPSQVKRGLFVSRRVYSSVTHDAIALSRLVRPALRNRPCFRTLQTSHRSLAEDPRTFKPPHYPEAEWHRVNENFERRLGRRSWFFRPLFRFMGHPKYHAGNVTFQFMLVVSLVGGWIYIWFFMGYAPKPVPMDGTGRRLSEDEVAEMETIENYLHSHPVVLALRSQKHHLIESRPHWSIPDKDIPHNLTGGTLNGLGRVSVAPIAFSDGEGTEFYAVLHIGRDVCGQDGYVHDGLLATILDESLARCCFPALPNRIGVTANLNIDYRKSIPVDSYLLVKVFAPITPLI
jgi:Thioesterase superfamily